MYPWKFEAPASTKSIFCALHDWLARRDIDIYPDTKYLTHTLPLLKYTSTNREGIPSSGRLPPMQRKPDSLIFYISYPSIVPCMRSCRISNPRRSDLGVAGGAFEQAETQHRTSFRAINFQAKGTNGRFAEVTDTQKHEESRNAVKDCWVSVP